jgi:hypothetical protein
MYEKSVLRPLVGAAREKMRSESPAKWDDRATAALAQLIRIETYDAQANPATNMKDPGQEAINLEPLARYVIENDDEFRLYKDKHAGKLQKSAKWLYTKEEGGGTWPPAGLGAGANPNGAQALTHGVRTFNEYWSQQVEGRSERRLAMTKLVESLEKFRAAEAAVKQLTATAPETKEAFERFKGNWLDSFATMKLARGDADTAVATLEKNNGWVSSRSLAELFEAEVTRTADEAEKAHQALIDHLPVADKSPAGLVAIAKTLSDALKRIPDVKQKALTAEQKTKTIPLIDQLYLTRGQDLQKKESRRYVIHYQVYELADRQMASSEPAPGVNFSNVAEELRKIDSAVDTNVVRETDTLLSGFTIGKEPVAEACNSAKAVADFAAKEKRFNLIMLALKAPAQNAQQVAQEIAGSQLAKNAPADALAYRQVPLTGFEADGRFSPEYYPDAAVNYIGGWKLVGDKIAEAATKPRGGLLSPSEVKPLYEKTRKPIEEYQREYIVYWRDGLREKLTVAALPAWDRIFAGPLKATQWEVKALSSIQDIDDKAHKAIEQIRPTLSAADAQALAGEPPPLTQREFLRLEEKCSAIVSRWRSLGSDAEKARREVIDIPSHEFLSSYVYPPDEKGARLAERYVAQYSIGMLEALAREAQRIARESLDKLKQMSRFPLAKPARGTGVLNQQEIAEARVLFGKIKVVDGGAERAGARAAIGGEKTKAQEYLEKLRGLALKPDEQEFVKRTENLLRALPEPGKTLRANIHWLPKEVQERYAAGARKSVPFTQFNYCEVIQAPAVPKDKAGKRTLNTEAGSIAEVLAPGDPIRMRFTETPALLEPMRISPRVDDKDYDLSSPWSLLWLLHGENGERLEQGKVWHVQVKLDEKESFWLRIEFLEFDLNRAIPPVAEWPELKAP